MVKFNLRKMFAVGLLSATAAFAGIAAMHGMPSMVAYATGGGLDTEDPDATPTPDPDATPTPDPDATPTPDPEKPSGSVSLSQPNYTDYTITITANGNSYVFLQQLKEKGESYTVSKTYCFEVKDGKVTVDLSFLNGKEAVLRAYGDSDMTPSGYSANVTVNSQPTKISVKYKYVDEEVFAKNLTVKSGQNTYTGIEGESQLTLANYQYRTLYSDDGWKSLADFAGSEWEAAKMTGTTIMVREKAGTDKPAGPEVKVKIPAAAKAPSVKIDYSKGTIKITDKQEYRVVANNSEASWTPGAKDPKKVVDIETGEFVLAVRTKGTDKKGPSAPTLIKVGAVPEIEKKPVEGKEAVVVKGNEAKNLTYEFKNDNKEITLTAVGASFDYDVDGKKGTVKPGKPVTIKSKAAIAKVTIQLSYAKDTTDKDTKEVISGNFASEGVELTIPSLDANEGGSN